MTVILDFRALQTSQSNWHFRTIFAVSNIVAEVNPFAPNGEDYGPLYFREDVEAVLK
ncbi:hypothetical protein [Sulfitobacter sp. SK012]|uniref:hypothetical protein n=1 Tax=Sulfitobacter sp. SK012 TaxID=1389005 RepID=UPI0013B39333|nr:hypothetical protein [Sulfitobacter sp. SK012]